MREESRAGKDLARVPKSRRDPGDRPKQRPPCRLVEGVSRQKTPNEIALGILLAGLTIVLLLATVSLQP